MKKVFTYITIATAALFLTASCSKNEPPVFNDNIAFVAFDAATASIAEAVPCLPSEVTDENMGFKPQEKTLKIPVTLGSLKGIEETVKFTIKEADAEGGLLYRDLKNPDGDAKDPANWIDKTAHAGVNYNLLTTSGTLTFNADNRTQYIEIQPLYVTDYTGDLKFDIELSTPANVSLGINSVCTVTISDVNHPLTAMLGEYTVTGDSYWYGVQSWTSTILKDENDDHMVWFNNLHNAATMSSLNVYGNVDDDMTTITLPFGQATEYVYSYGVPCFLYGFNGDAVDSGNWVVSITKDDKGKVTGLDFGKEYGLWLISFNEDYSSNYNFAIYKPGMTAVKK